MTWHDDGLKLRVYVSESGDFVSLGTRTDYPFQSGGPGGAPLGWSQFMATAGTAGEVNWTTSAQGRFSMSNAAAVPVENRWWGIGRNFRYRVGYRYIVNVQCQTMDGKSSATRYVRQSYVSGSNPFGTLRTSVSPWENIATMWDTANPTVDFDALLLLAVYGTADPNWGVQWQSVSITEVPDTAPQPVWYETTCDIRNMSCRSGRERMGSRYEVASLQLGINNDDGFWTYQPNHPKGLRPGRFIKLEAELDGVTYPVFYGIIDGMTQAYGLDGRVIANLSAVDVSSLLSNTTVPTITQGDDSILSSSRVDFLLRSVGWHPSMKDIQPGVFYQQGILANGRTLRDEMGLSADSEGSFFFADRQGKIAYRGRDWSADRVTKVGVELLATPEPEAEHVPYVKFQFPGVTGNFMQSPRTADMDMTGYLQVTARLSHDNWSGPSSTFVGRWGIASAWLFGKASDSRRLLLNATAGAARTSTADVPFANGALGWVRAIYTVSTGQTIFYTAPDSETEPTTWTQLGTTVAGTAGQAIGIHATAPLTIGANDNGISATAGRIAEAIVRTTNGVEVYRLREIDAYDQVGTLAFLSTSGDAVAVTQTATNVIVQDAGVYEFLPEVDGIPDIAPSIPFICTRELTTSWDRARVINELDLANAGGSAVSFSDFASQQKYGPRTYQRMDLINRNDHPEYITLRAADIMDGYTEALLRVDKVSFRPKVATWPYTLGVFLNDLVRVRYENELEQWGYSVVAHVQGVEHSANQQDWVTTLALDDYQAFNFWSGSEPGQGWDEGIWDTNIWDGGFIAHWSSGQLWSVATSIWG